jgi:hypothetical protein
MDSQDAKVLCEIVAAIAALLAAGFWFGAASHPVGVPRAAQWDDSPQAKTMAEEAPKIRRGAE